MTYILDSIIWSKYQENKLLNPEIINESGFTVIRAKKGNACLKMSNLILYIWQKWIQFIIK